MKKILFICVILIAGSYWFILRPHQIRKQCYNACHHSLEVVNKPQAYNPELVEKSKMERELIDASYIKCLGEHGVADVH